MKKSMSMLMLVVLSVLLCGCNSKVPDLTPEQTALISEYATYLLVKHSELSERSLLDEQELEEGILKEAQEKERKMKADEIAQTYLHPEVEMVDGVTQEESDDTDSEQESVVLPSQTVAEFLGEDSFVIDYESYELCESYPAESEDEFYMAMDATPGRQLCIVKFAVRNITPEDRELNMLGKKGNYMLNMPDGETISAQTTMLLDDISSFKGSIVANATEQMVLVFEVDDSVTQMDAVELVIKNESGENIISL